MKHDSARKTAVEGAAQAVFTLCGCFSVFAVIFITLYMMVGGVPAVFKVGIKEILFRSVWEPVAAEPKYGILYIILTSVIGTGLAVMLGAPVGILTAVFLAEMAERRMAAVIRSGVELMAGIPSVVYGLLGNYLLNPLMYRLEQKIFAGSRTHQFTGGSNLLSAVFVLAIMILPTIISVSETSLALGASRTQTIFHSVLPAAKSGVVTAIVLAVGRAIGEAMAITLVSGNSVNLPLPFHSVRFLTSAVVTEMSYAQGTHRQMLFTIGLLLFLFIMIINMILNHVLKKGRET